MKDRDLFISKIVVATFFLFSFYMIWELGDINSEFLVYNRAVNIEAQLADRQLTREDITILAQIARREITVRKDVNLAIVHFVEEVEFRAFGTYVINRPVVVVLCAIPLGLLGLFIGQVNPGRRITRPPGSLIEKIAKVLPKKQREIILQEYSDMLTEVYEAYEQKEFAKARFLIVCYHVGLCFSALVWISDKIRKILGINPKMD